ncbi:MAG: hypothetical protein OEM84_07885 [Acidimicrobiia bacterium]|nr:hypothetical protein [Acidimicrobiia bacterium]
MRLLTRIQIGHVVVRVLAVGCGPAVDDPNDPRSHLTGIGFGGADTKAWQQWRQSYKKKTGHRMFSGSRR